MKTNTKTQLEWMSNSSFPPFPLLSDTDKEAFLDKLHRERDRLFEEAAKLTINAQSVNGDLNKILKALER